MRSRFGVLARWSWLKNRWFRSWSHDLWAPGDRGLNAAMAPRCLDTTGKESISRPDVEAWVMPLEFSCSTDAPARDYRHRPNRWTTHLFASELIPQKGLIREIVRRSQVLPRTASQLRPSSVCRSKWFMMSGTEPLTHTWSRCLYHAANEKFRRCVYPTFCREVPHTFSHMRGEVQGQLHCFHR